jgi:hypothetical protein
MKLLFISKKILEIAMKSYHQTNTSLVHGIVQFKNYVVYFLSSLLVRNFTLSIIVEHYFCIYNVIFLLNGTNSTELNLPDCLRIRKNNFL